MPPLICFKKIRIHFFAASWLLVFILMTGMLTRLAAQSGDRSVINFNQHWKFYLGEASNAPAETFNDAAWRSLQLPHDWSIELPFDSTSPTGTGGGALRGGLGWYRKTFTLPASAKDKNVFIDFDGVYCNSEVFINGHSLGIRPNGFISFRYNLTPYLKFNNQQNVIAVKVDNSQQPNSRWYSGSGIYRNVWLVTTGNVYVEHWGQHITTPVITDTSASVLVATRLVNASGAAKPITLVTTIYNQAGAMVASNTTKAVPADSAQDVTQTFPAVKSREMGCGASLFIQCCYQSNHWRKTSG